VLEPYVQSCDNGRDDEAVPKAALRPRCVYRRVGHTTCLSSCRHSRKKSPRRVERRITTGRLLVLQGARLSTRWSAVRGAVVVPGEPEHRREEVPRCQYPAASPLLVVTSYSRHLLQLRSFRVLRG
jgi:hypothetical protein